MPTIRILTLLMDSNSADDVSYPDGKLHQEQGDEACLPPHDAYHSLKDYVHAELAGEDVIQQDHGVYDQITYGKQYVRIHLNCICHMSMNPQYARSACAASGARDMIEHLGGTHTDVRMSLHAAP